MKPHLLWHHDNNNRFCGLEQRQKELKFYHLHMEHILHIIFDTFKWENCQTPLLFHILILQTLILFIKGKFTVRCLFINPVGILGRMCSLIDIIPIMSIIIIIKTHHACLPRNLSIQVITDVFIIWDNIKYVTELKT